MKGGLIQADVTFAELGKVPFVCDKNDSEPHSIRMYEEIKAGKWGPILPEDKAGTLEVDTLAAKHARAVAIGSTQWIVDRHRDELDLGSKTSISKANFMALLVYRKELRDWPTKPDFPNYPPECPVFLIAMRARK